MSGHRFVHGQIAAHVIVVLLEEGFLALRAPIFRRRLDREECLSILLERSRRIAVSDPLPPFEFRHDNDIKRLSGTVTRSCCLVKSVASRTIFCAQPTMVLSSGCCSASFSSTATVTFFLSSRADLAAFGKYFS